MNHFQEAERLLAEAAELAHGPRIGVARTLAEIAKGHAALAQVKASRQLTGAERAELWQEGYLQAGLDAMPAGLDPEERILHAVAALPSHSDNPYRVAGEEPANAHG